MKLYKSCSTLSIARFFRIFDGMDLRNLIVDFDFENETLKLNKKQIEEFGVVFQDIFYEYTDLTNNIKARSNIRKQILIQQWETTYFIVIECVNLYFKTKDIEYLNFLIEVECSIDLEKPIEPQLKSLLAKMKGLKNKIKIHKINFAKNFSEDKKDVKIDLDKEALYLEKNLDLKREIDPETTSISKWVKLIEISKLKLKDNG